MDPLVDADGSAEMKDNLEPIVQAMRKLLATEASIRGDDDDNSSVVWSQSVMVCGYRTDRPTTKSNPKQPAVFAGEEAKGAAAAAMLLRKVFRWGFRMAVRLLCGNSIAVRDTQCGFKLLTTSAAWRLYGGTPLFLSG